MQVTASLCEHDRTGTGEQSGIETDVQFTQVLTFRKGEVVLDEYFLDHQDALKAAGLRE